MSKVFRGALLVLATFVLAACTGNNPGALEGTWAMTDPIPMTVSFRSGETEAMSMIEKVSYKTQGNDVLVTYKDGLAKGITMRYTVVDANTVRSESGVLRRVR